MVLVLSDERLNRTEAKEIERDERYGQEKVKPMRPGFYGRL